MAFRGSEMVPVGDEVTVVEVNRRGNLLSVLMGEYAYLGGAHPDYGMFAWNYDLNNGAFVDLTSLTDRRN